MLEPKSKLPWSITNETNELVDASYYSIFGATHDNTAITDEVDGNYIVQACNNFPKAVELLKRFGWYLDSINTQHDLEGLNNWNKTIKEFLKSLEKDGK